MSDGLAELAARLFSDGPEERVHGLALALVIDNVDPMSEGRVQLQLPWLPGFEPWARVSVPAAGSSRGFWIMPQVDDEVLVGFDGGDVRSPYVVGSLWNGTDRPPATAPNDAITKTILHTQAGHVIELDDAKQTVTITTSSGQKVALAPEQIELTAGSSKATLKTTGSISLESGTDIKIKSTSVSIEATDISVKAGGSLALQGGGTASVQGGVVRIN